MGIISPIRAEEAAWSPIALETSQDLIDVSFADASNGWVAGAFKTVLKTRNAGETWESVSIPVSASFFSAFAMSADDVFIARNSLNRTTDGGENWTVDIGDFGSRASSIFDIQFVSLETGFLVQSGRIFRTVDGGAVWNDVSEFDGLFLDSIQVADAETLYATGGITYIEIFGSRTEGNMARSRNGGVTWQAVPLGGIDEIHAAVWFDGKVGIIFTFSGAAFQTEDGGDTWETVITEMVDTEGGRIGIVTDALIADDGMIVGVTFDGAIVESLGGDVWTRKAEVVVPWNGLTKTPDGTIFAVGNGGRMWKRSPGSGQNEPPGDFRIAGISLDKETGKVAISVEGEAARDYRLDTSADLRKWVEVKTQTASESAFQFETDAPGDGVEAWYRVVQLPRRL